MKQIKIFGDLQFYVLQDLVNEWIRQNGINASNIQFFIVNEYKWCIITYGVILDV